MQDSSIITKKILSIYIDALELSNRGAIWVNDRGIILGTNSNFAQQIGYTKADCVDKMIFEINPHLSVMAWRKLWKQLLKEKTVSLEAEHLTAEDELFPVKVRWELIEIEGVAYGCGIVEDLITFSRYEDLLNIAGEISRVAVWEWDVVHNEFFFSEQFNKLFNLPENFNLDRDTIQSFMSNMIDATTMGQLVTNITNAIKTGKPFGMELDLRQSANLGIASINFTAKPLYIEERTIKIYGTIQDLSQISGRTEEMYLAQFCLDYAQDPILWIDEKGAIVYANQAAALTYDYLPAEFLEATIFDIVPKFNATNYVTHWEELADRGMMEYESLHLRNAATPFPVWVSLNYIRYQGKAFNCLFVKDLTDQKIKEEELLLTKASVDKAEDMVFWVNQNGEFIYVNEKMGATLEYTSNELKQLAIFDIAANYSKADWKQHFEKLVALEEVELPSEYVTKSKKTIPVKASINYIKYGEEAMVVAFVKNQTKKKARDEQIKLSMSTIEGSSDMILWLDETANVVYANHEVSNNLGYSKTELVGKKVFKIAPAQNAKEWKDYWQKIKTAKNLVYDSIMKRKNGRVVPVEITINYVSHRDKEILSIYAKDITERKAETLKLELAYDEIKRLKEEAEVENTILKDEIKLESSFNNIICASDAYKKVLKKVEQVADSDATVLILGETGTGKELLARAVHQLSNRSERPMIKVNCGALPPNLIESELFGHEKGAFTGAYQTKKGRFELAHKGTIFLDEIGELPLDLQAKLLRVLQEGEFEKVGGTKTEVVDVRVVAATNRNLEAKVAKEEFREDLYYRLNVFPIDNIPLRERKDDIAPLIRFFVDKYSKKMGKKIKEIPEPAIKKLTAYDFPGNVRELENIIERSIIISRDEILSFDTSLFRTQRTGKNSFPSLDEIQKAHIIEALRRTNGRISGSIGAASLLQINDKTLVSRMKKLGVKKKDYQ